MSSFAPMIQVLASYHALEFHHNPQLAARLSAIQNWQKKRMQHIHADIFAVPAHHLITQYFLEQLYSGADFDVLAEQCERVLSAAKVFEGLFPDSAVRTALKATKLAVLAIELDHQLAQLMNHDLLDDRQDPAINDQQMIRLYRLADQANARFHQLELLDELGLNLDKYVRSKVIYGIFRLSKGMTQRYQLNALYAFMNDGFAAMKPLKSAKVFFGEFTQAERDVLDEIYSGNPNPFSRRVKHITPSQAASA